MEQKFMYEISKMQLSSFPEILENGVLFLTRNLPKFKSEFVF